MQRKEAPAEEKQKRFAGRAPLAELGHRDSDETSRFSVRALSEAVVIGALEGGLTREKAVDVLAALPKATS